MTYSRSRLALFAAALIALLVVVGFLYTNSQKHPSAAPAPSASAAPSAQGDDEDSTEGQDTAEGAAQTVAAIPAGPMPGTAAAVKTVHSPDKVAVDINLAPGQCKVPTVSEGREGVNAQANAVDAGEPLGLRFERHQHDRSDTIPRLHD
ncbi:hypothetical protein [Pseudarthrobacter sp. NIBRBAC000502770]|uniref:hypothetical protein n=1 Tax=Pseudarthrobacter sp. NIBRBAC000502770 TaxID=2590785 RepID=UPI0011402C86|nr:hypothetical protein [Pseudarthrobacter sp. NIBRBAC000502770]QDG89091.1 hypothetical protein NIBR502770_11835 [Pseudarthrobacter sp. NIBRBAC000502770]